MKKTKTKQGSECQSSLVKRDASDGRDRHITTGVSSRKPLECRQRSEEKKGKNKESDREGK